MPVNPFGMTPLFLSRSRLVRYALSALAENVSVLFSASRSASEMRVTATALSWSWKIASEPTDVIVA